MTKIIKIKKGLNIPLAGGIPTNATIKTDEWCNIFAIIPDDYPGYTWKLSVKVGESVKVGTPLLYAKECETIKLTSPISGTVKEIKRGERRHIEFVSVEKNTTGTQEEIIGDDILTKLKLSGLFAFMRQRPFDIVPMNDIMPRDIFVTSFDTAPLAADMMNSLTKEYLESGLKVLSQFTSGKVYLSIPADSQISSTIAEVIQFSGPHPAGNVGTQIANISPVNKGEMVWTLDAITASRIGKFAETGTLDFNTEVALTGTEIKDHCIINTTIGASVSSLLKDNLAESESKIRIISGNVLTGIKVTENVDFLHYPYRQITAIPEGDNADEFMGWASMSPSKFSVKRTFPAFLLSKLFNFDTRVKGGHRAMIMSGEYDKVFPFDIYPEYLIKAILAKNIEKMEERGIYEVAPEDFALPEFVDTSKLELQKIVRDGLNYLRKETL